MGISISVLRYTDNGEVFYLHINVKFWLIEYIYTICNGCKVFWALVSIYFYYDLMVGWDASELWRLMRCSFDKKRKKFFSSI